MHLKSIQFCRFKGEINEWSIEGKTIDGQVKRDLTLENINLIVGKNASGKTKTIDAIRYIADLISGDTKLSKQVYFSDYQTADYQLNFDDNGKHIEYKLDFKEGKIIQEILSVDHQEKLNRAEGKLWYEGAQSMLDFQTDDNILAVSKRDKKQHSFFEKLYRWGKNLSHYRFGRALGKNTWVRDINAIKDSDEISLKDSDDVIEIFVQGERKFHQPFVRAILEDMKTIGYNLKTIKAGKVKNLPILAYGLNVQEIDLEDVTEQKEMSQGMFRALSLLVQLNYSLMSKIPSCILIDDIGEGLDYDRSKSLIELIIKKSKGSAAQVIMTTNDRFVMNNIPLIYWSAIQRLPKKSIFYNYQNSKETFDEFTYTGLNNFDFLKTEFYINGFDTIQNEPHS
jgi:AAA15 family ATPase/GTPase